MRRNEWITFALSAALIGAIAIAPAPVRAVAGEDFYISDNEPAASVGVGTGCALPDVQYVEVDGLEDALAAIYEDDDYGDDGDTIILCDIDADAGDADYLMHDDVGIDDDDDAGTPDAATYDAVDAAAAINLTIRGNAEDADSIIIDADDNDGEDEGGYSPFDFTDTHLTIRNMTILNAWDDSEGAGIHHIQDDATDTVTLTLDTVVIEYAYAADNGAGVYSGGDVDVYDSIFEENGIGGGAIGSGAAIYALGDVDVTDSTFEGNYSNVQGGAIWSDADVSITGSMFVGNWTDRDEDGEGADTATGDEGGAIYAADGVVVSDSSFVNNESPTLGGAICALGAVTIEDSSFSGNEAGEDGGAVAAGATASVTAGSHFENNVAGAMGGALFVGDGDLLVEDSVFTGNHAEEGGAINNDDNGASTEIHSSRFTDNFSDGEQGGAIHTDGDIEVSRSTFFGNSTISDEESGDGGAIHVSGDGHSRITTSVFRENSALDSGGALYLEDCESAEISSSIFTDNEAADSGGAVNNVCDSDSVVEVIGNTFVGNHAHSYGGAMDNDADDGAITIYIRNVFFRNTVLGSPAPGEGGAVWVYSGRFTKNVFRSNRALTCGGAVYLDETDFNTLKSGRNSFSSNRGSGSRRYWDVCR